MKSPVSPPAIQDRWTSLWVVALLSLLGQLWLCQFFTFGEKVPASIDINPSNLWKFAYHFPPTGTFEVLNWLGVAYLPQPLNPFSLAALLRPEVFFTAYAPVIATLSLLAMAAFLRELECPRPAAIFGGVVYAWQGDLLPFVFPAHFAYITTWPFFALAAWGALRAHRTRYWAYAVISGVSCGLMVGLQPDRGAIASLLIAVLYITPILSRLAKGRAILGHLVDLRHLALCVTVALLVSLAAFMALFQTYIVGVKLGGIASREDTYKFVTQFSLGPAETLTYLVPGFFGWHSNNGDGPYWGWIGELMDWPQNHRGAPNLNLAISTTGTVATVLALIGACLLLPGRLLGPSQLSERQRMYGRVLLALGLITLILSWGWHTPFYRSVYALPLMDKWRNPLKWLEMTNFALAVLSAFGVQHLLTSLEAEAPDVNIVRRRVAWFSNGMLILLLLGLLASYPFAIILAKVLQMEGYDPGSIANIMNTMHNSLLVALVLMALFCFVLYALWRPNRLRGWTLENPLLNRLWKQMLRKEHLPLTLTLGLTALCVAQMGWVATQFLQPTDLAMLTSTNPLLEALKNEDPTVRVSVAAEDPLLNVLLLNQFAADKIPSVDISAASRIPDDINTFLYGSLKENQSRIWFLAGVKDVVMPQRYVAEMRNDPAIVANVDHVDGYTLEQPAAPNVPSHALVTMRDYLAKATLAPRAEVLPYPKDLIARLKDPAWNPRDSILLAVPAAGPLPQPTGPAATTNHVEVTTYTPTDIVIEVQSTQGGYLLVNDQYDPDWRAQVNGHDAELLRADYLMRAVVVPPGNSTVTMHYGARYHLGEMVRQMTRFDIGNITLSAESVNNFSDGVMLASWLVAGLALWQRREQPQPENPS